MAFQCTVVTPEQQVLDETIVQAIIPAHDGKTGILTDRAPLLTKLGTGVLRLDTSAGQRRQLVIDGGIAQMKDNKLTILTQYAADRDNIDAATAQAELSQANNLRIGDERSAHERERAIARAQAKLELVGQ